MARRVRFGMDTAQHALKLLEDGVSRPAIMDRLGCSNAQLANMLLRAREARALTSSPVLGSHVTMSGVRFVLLSMETDALGWATATLQADGPISEVLSRRAASTLKVPLSTAIKVVLCEKKRK